MRGVNTGGRQLVRALQAARQRERAEAAIDRARKSERAAIVAWLREQGQEWTRAAIDQPKASSAPFKIIRGDNCKHLATAIESGEHLRGDGDG